MAENSQKRPKMTQNGQKSAKNDLFRPWCQYKKCFYWSKLTLCQISKKSENIDFACDFEACPGTFLP